MILGVFRIGVGFRRSGKLESGLFDQLDRIVLADISGLCLLFLRYVGTAPVVDDTQYAARLQRRVKILEGRIDLVPVEPVVEITKGEYEIRGASRRNGMLSDRKSTRLNSSHPSRSRMPSSA